MKNNILLIGIILTFLNTIIGLVLNNYSNFTNKILGRDIAILVFYVQQEFFTISLTHPLQMASKLE